MNFTAYKAIREELRTQTEAQLRWTRQDAQEAGDLGIQINNPRANEYLDLAHYCAQELQSRR